MKRKDFYALCGELMIDVNVALENEALRLALFKGNDNEVGPEQARRAAIDCDEGAVILENSHAYIGVSEYCGLACLWLLPKEHGGYYPEDIRLDNLDTAWCAKITPKFYAKLGELNKVGSFSNGESVYERKQSKG